MPGRTSGLGTSAIDNTSGPPTSANTMAFTAFSSVSCSWWRFYGNVDVLARRRGRSGGAESVLSSGAAPREESDEDHRRHADAVRVGRHPGHDLRAPHRQVRRPEPAR